MQEEVLKLVLLALEDGSALSRKVTKLDFAGDSQLIEMLQQSSSETCLYRTRWLHPFGQSYSEQLSLINQSIRIDFIPIMVAPGTGDVRCATFIDAVSARVQNLNRPRGAAVVPGQLLCCGQTRRRLIADAVEGGGCSYT